MNCFLLVSRCFSNNTPGCSSKSMEISLANASSKMSPSFCHEHRSAAKATRIAGSRSIDPSLLQKKYPHLFGSNVSLSTTTMLYYLYLVLCIRHISGTHSRHRHAPNTCSWWPTLSHAESMGPLEASQKLLLMCARVYRCGVESVMHGVFFSHKNKTE